MKKFFFALILMAAFTAQAQDCEYSIDDATEGQELKTTKEYLMQEKIAISSQYLFFSLSNSQGLPLLNLQVLSKSKDFIKTQCIDAKSKIYVQLANGKIVTLISATEDQCAGLVYDETEKNNIRILTGTFLFTKGALEELEKSPISFIRIKFATETIDYPVKRELVSETMKGSYFPETYFMNTIKCIK